MSRIESLKSKRKSFAIVLAMFAIVGLLAAGTVLLSLGLQGRVFAILLLIWVLICLKETERDPASREPKQASGNVAQFSDFAPMTCRHAQCVQHKIGCL